MEIKLPENEKDPEVIFGGHICYVGRKSNGTMTNNEYEQFCIGCCSKIVLKQHHAANSCLCFDCAEAIKKLNTKTARDELEDFEKKEKQKCILTFQNGYGSGFIDVRLVKAITVNKNIVSIAYQSSNSMIEFDIPFNATISAQEFVENVLKLMF